MSSEFLLLNQKDSTQLKESKSLSQAKRSISNRKKKKSYCHGDRKRALSDSDIVMLLQLRQCSGFSCGINCPFKCLVNVSKALS